MRLLHVTSSYPLVPDDGTAPFMAEMTQALAARGHSVRVITPITDGLQTGLRSGVEVTSYRYAPRRLQVWGYGRSSAGTGGIRTGAIAVAPAAMLSMLTATRNAVRSWKPDVVHLHWLVPQGVLAPLLPSPVPVVVSLHGADMGVVSRSRFLSSAGKFALRSTDHVVAASRGMFDMIAALDPTVLDRSSVILHGANSRLFHPGERSEARSGLGVDTAQRALVAVGRLVPKKGFEYLIQSMAMMPDDVHLYIAGDGPSRSDLEDLATRVTPGRVTFLGMLTRDVLANWYTASDAVVVPSVRTNRDIDSGPVVLMEALASGRPVISTPVGMAPAVIQDDYNGFIVAEADPSALADAVSRALPHADRLGTNAAETFRRVGDWDRVAQELEGVYEAAVARRTSLRH